MLAPYMCIAAGVFPGQVQQWFPNTHLTVTVDAAKYLSLNGLLLFRIDGPELLSRIVSDLYSA